jgi:polysaccharide pyruvyl transferase WcaK-like protein
VEVEGFCFHNQISSDFSKTVELLVECGIAPHRVCPPDLDYRDACRRIASYQGIVTCRFHATVVANVLGVPAIATADGSYYTSKMQVAIAGAKSARVIDPGVNAVDEALSEILGRFNS